MDTIWTILLWALVPTACWQPLIARSNVAIGPIVSFFLAVLKAGAMGMQQSTGVPKSIVDTITATFICVATMDLLFTFYGSKKKKNRRKSGKEGQEA